MSPPLVSIILPSFNHEQYIGEALQSAFDQDYPNIELLVLDDGSSDRTPEIIAEMIEDSPFPVQFEVQANAGLATSLNRLLAKASGDWIFPLSSDDYFFPDRISTCLAFANRFPDAAAFHTNALIVEEKGRVTGRVFPNPLIAANGESFVDLSEGLKRIAAPTLFAKRERLSAIGQYDPLMIAEDLDFHLRLSRSGPIYFLPQDTMGVRVTPNSLGKAPWLWGDSIIRALEKHSDRLGSRLPVLLAKASENVSAACFEHGKPLVGLTWGRRALGYSPTAASRAATAGRVVARGLRGTGRFALVSLFGRERLVRFKRRLGR